MNRQSIINELLFTTSVKDLKNGYIYDNNTKLFTCLLCGTTYEKGIIYQKSDQFVDAEKAVIEHISEAHDSVFSFLINLDKKYTGITDHQKSLLEGFYSGLKDKDIAANSDLKTTSSIRNQRFILREREKQAKVFLCIMELLNEGSKNAKDPESKLIPIHGGAKMIDDRYVTTEKEETSILEAYFENKKLKTFPSKEKKKIVILKYLLKSFDKEKKYSEKEINEIIKAVYPDFATIRRYFIEYGFMERTKDCSQYWVK